MKSYRLIIVTVIQLLILKPFPAFGWGQYGHQQVNSAAIDLLDANSSIGKCLKDARKTIVRYAITPDVEWKEDEVLKTLAENEKGPRREADCYEHPLHFFEADAFIKPTIGADKLPHIDGLIGRAPSAVRKKPAQPDPDEGGKATGSKMLDSDFKQTAYPELLAALNANLDYANMIDPSKKVEGAPKVRDVIGHGTAPWRARSLYIQAVAAMQQKDFKKALLLLGTMGHYVGDMSQPFHAALNFDGDYPVADKQAGVHHEIDTGLFEDFNGDAAENDKKNNGGVYPSFAKTNDAVVAEGAKDFKSYPAGFSKDDVVNAIVADLVVTGFPVYQQLLDAYKIQCDSANGILVEPVANRPKRMPRGGDRTVGNGSHGSRPIEASDVEAKDVAKSAYCVPIPEDSGHGTKLRAIGSKREQAMNKENSPPPNVLEALEIRLGKSAGLLARLWMSAWQDANKPDMSNCAGITFDQDYAINNYPKPTDYYPTDASFNGMTQPGCAGVPRAPSSVKSKSKMKKAN